MSMYVINEGSAPQRQITFNSFKPENWEVSFEPETVEALEPGDMKQVEIKIKSAPEALVGDYSVTVSAQGEDASHDLELRVTVKASATWGWIGIIVTVAITPFVGPIFASIIGSAVGTLVNGGTWKSFAIGVGIAISAGAIASGIGSSFGGEGFWSGVSDYFSDTAGTFAQWAGQGIAEAFAAGALTGAIAGQGRHRRAP